MIYGKLTVREIASVLDISSEVHNILHEHEKDVIKIRQAPIPQS